MLKFVAPILIAVGLLACVDDDKDPIPPDDDEGETDMTGDPDQVDPDDIAQPGEEEEEDTDEPGINACDQLRTADPGKGDNPCGPSL